MPEAKKEDLTRFVLKNTLLSFIALFGGAVVNYFFRRLMIGHFGTEDYGLFYAVLSLVSTFIGFRYLGMGTAVVHDITTARVNGDWKTLGRTFGTFSILSFAMFGILSAILVVSGRWSSDHYFQDPRAYTILLVLVAAHLLSTMETNIQGLLQGLRILAPISWLTIFRSIMLIIIFWATINQGITSGAYAYLITFAINVVLYVVLAFKYARLAIRHMFVFDWSAFKRLFAFSMKMNVGTLSGIVMGSFGTLCLTWFKTLTDVAMFNVAQPIADMIRFIPKAISNIVFPLSAEMAKTNPEKFATGIVKLHKYTLIVILPICLGLMFYSESIVKTLFNADVAFAAKALWVLGIGQICSAFSGPNLWIIAGFNKPEKFALYSVGGAAVMAIATVALVPSYGIVGAAWGDVIGEAVTLVFSFYGVKKLLSVSFPWSAWLRTILCGAVLYACMSWLSSLLHFGVVLTAIAGFGGACVAYAVCVFLLRIISFTEIRQLLYSGKNKRVA